MRMDDFDNFFDKVDDFFNDDPFKKLDPFGGYDNYDNDEPNFDDYYDPVIGGYVIPKKKVKIRYRIIRNGEEVDMEDGDDDIDEKDKIEEID